MRRTKKGGGVMQMAKRFMRVFVRNYSGARFIVPSQGLIPGTSPFSGPTGDWEYEILGSCGIMT